MPWVNRRQQNTDGTSRGQKILNIFTILSILVLFVAITSYRTSIDMIDGNVSSLRAELSEVNKGGDDVPRAVASIDEGDADALRQDADDLREDVAEVRVQVLSLGDELKTLASKSVDVRSMEALRDELLVTKKKILRIETGMQALDDAPGDGPSTSSTEDIATALSIAREARDELRKFKTMLGYSDM